MTLQTVTCLRERAQPLGSCVSGKNVPATYYSRAAVS